MGFGNSLVYSSKLVETKRCQLSTGGQELRLASVPALVSACYAKKSNSREEAFMKRRSCSWTSRWDVYPDMGIPVH